MLSLADALLDRRHVGRVVEDECWAVARAVDDERYGQQVFRVDSRHCALQMAYVALVRIDLKVLYPCVASAGDFVGAERRLLEAEARVGAAREVDVRCPNRASVRCGDSGHPFEEIIENNCKLIIKVISDH